MFLNLFLQSFVVSSCQRKIPQTRQEPPQGSQHSTAIWVSNSKDAMLSLGKQQGGGRNKKARYSLPPTSRREHRLNEWLNRMMTNASFGSRAIPAHDASSRHEACWDYVPASSDLASVGSVAVDSSGFACWIGFWCRSYVELLPIPRYHK